MTPITALPTELAAMREVVETLAPIERAAGEPGEHKAAEWIVERLRTAGAQDARIEEEQYLDGYPRLHLKLSVIGWRPASRACSADVCASPPRWPGWVRAGNRRRLRQRAAHCAQTNGDAPDDMERGSRGR
ncbi:hypothetical protein RN10_2967 [Mycobacterium tuberculosis]|nr:hypothetical protein RN10_2967 [Mycobacterium tuberculosis]